MAGNLPYVTTKGTLLNMLEKIKTAAVPPTFSKTFVEETLAMKGGRARSTIPFLKKMGFVAQDGTPTELYKSFRNEAKSGKAVAEAMRLLYAPLFAKNEKVYELGDSALKGLIVETTGALKDAQVTKMTVATFKALNELADFKGKMRKTPQAATGKQEAPKPSEAKQLGVETPALRPEGTINLGYTINLNLPASTDVEVFNAIFRSLRTHLIER